MSSTVLMERLAEEDRAGDVEELIRLKVESDPRGIAQMKAEDSWTEGTVVEVVEGDDGWEVQWEEKIARDGPDGEPTETGMGKVGCYLKRVEGGPVPEVGDLIRHYGRGFGYPFHGVEIDGEELFYRTPWERFAERMAMLAGFDRQSRERFEEQREELDAKYDALPEALKLRFDRFRAEDPDFRHEGEAYEMAAAWDGAKIADYLRPQAIVAKDEKAIERLVRDFHALSWEEQKAAIPDLDEGHSGNTFAGACRLALGLLLGREL